MPFECRDRMPAVTLVSALELDLTLTAWCYRPAPAILIFPFSTLMSGC